MKNLLTQSLFWSPRILTFLFAIFLSVFALDVFGQGNYGFWETFLALVMHLIPTFILLAILVLAWRWEWLGAILFLTLGAMYLVMEWGVFNWSAYAVISGPLAFIGFLFLADWRYRKMLVHTI